MRPTFADLTRPFYVGRSERLDRTHRETYDSNHFETLEAAEASYAELYEDRRFYVYLGEIGIFEENDALEVDYVTFRSNNEDWWSEINAAPGHPHRNVRGFGRAARYEETPEDGITPYKFFTVIEVR